MLKFPDFSRKLVCRACQRETTHRPLNRDRIDEDPKQIDAWTYTWRMALSMKCRDCGTMTFIIDHYVGDNRGGDPGVEKTEYFPPLPFRFKQKWFCDLPTSYQSTLNEVYVALDNSLYCLASGGTRTIIDCLIVDQIGDVGNFRQKVDTLVAKAIIDSDERESLLALIDAGSASMHRSFNPSKDLINHMMDILEKILFKVCIEPKEKKELKTKAEALRRETPRREQR
jgi:hypothetical protein